VQGLQEKWIFPAHLPKGIAPAAETRGNKTMKPRSVQIGVWQCKTVVVMD
jgi:hypothetical protein